MVAELPDNSGLIPGAGIAKGETETYTALYPSGPSVLGTVFTVLGIVLVLGVVIAIFFRARGSLSGGGGYRSGSSTPPTSPTTRSSSAWSASWTASPSSSSRRLRRRST